MRLKERFSITMDAGAHFMIGMDISYGEGWFKICSSTYIMNMLHAHVHAHAHVHVHAHVTCASGGSSILSGNMIT